MQSRREEKATLSPRAAAEVKFDLVSVDHAANFRGSPKGYAPVGPLLSSVPLSGDPQATPPFATRVRLRADRATSTEMEVRILAPSGELVMSGGSKVILTGDDAAEGESVIVWDATPRREAGVHQVQVRVGGRALGASPLEFVVSR